MTLAILAFMLLIPVGLYLYAKFMPVEGYEDKEGFHEVKR